MRTHNPAPLLLALFAAAPATCLGWGGENHQLIASVAEERLGEKAKAGIAGLLDGAALSDAEVVSWADRIRRERRDTAPWHYVNIPVDASGYDAKRDGHSGDNVIDKVEHFSRVPSDEARPRD